MSRADIKYFFLKGLELEDVFALQSFPNVSIVDCESGNSVDSLVPLKNLKNLKELYFSGNKINNLEPLSELKQLEVLDLSDNRLTYIKELCALINLKKLYLDTNKIYDITFLSNLTSLEELDISRNEISDIKSLSKLKRLKVLRLSYNHLNDEKIIELGKQIRSCKIYFESPLFELGYLLIKEIDYIDVPFFVSHIYNPNVGHCRVALLDDRFKSKRNIIDEMKTICREVVNSSNRENLIIRDLKREHFFEESSEYVRAQFDY